MERGEGAHGVQLKRQKCGETRVGQRGTQVEERCEPISWAVVDVADFCHFFVYICISRSLDPCRGANGACPDSKRWKSVEWRGRHGDRWRSG